MKTISLVIPFYNTSRYLLDAVKYAIDDDFISEIIINDDRSTDQEIERLNDIVCDLDSGKIKIHGHEKNLGGFRNKFEAVEHSTNEWVYLLDSDNHPHDTTYDVIKSIENPDPNICYCPQTLLLQRDNSPEPYDSKTYNFEYELIGLKESKDAIAKGTEYFDWFLNTGNFIVNREKYLERLLDGYNNKEEPVYACSVAFSYHWMNNNGLYKIVPNMKYYHRVRSDSYWVTCGNNSNLSMDYYTNKIKNSSL
tara:strand:- start:834 stop:1586 length:753 start_codon:yes stop_codon:yes gene_type:complete